MNEIYYQAEMRIGEKVSTDKGKRKSYSTGYFIIENNIIRGYFALDFVIGYLDQNNIYLELLDYNQGIHYSFIEKGKIQGVGNYFLSCKTRGMEKVYTRISIQEEIQEIFAKQEIKQELQRVTKIHNYP